MKSARDWLSPDSLEPHFGPRSHPDDYDPTDDQLESLVAAVQKDAWNSAIDAAEKAVLPGSVESRILVFALKKD